MPVLLLAHGDPQAKDMLRRAIEARYGSRPPVLDSLRIDFKGRARVKIGPITTRVPVDASAHFRFPVAARWDFTVKPLGLPVQRGVEAYDGTTYHAARGGKRPAVITDIEQVHSLRRRLWAIASILLTPLSNTYVKIESNGDSTFQAINTELDDAAELYLDASGIVKRVHVHCSDPDGQQRVFRIELSVEQKTLNDLILPKQISAYWDDTPAFELEPVAAVSNPQIPDSVFTLAGE